MHCKQGPKITVHSNSTLTSNVEKKKRCEQFWNVNTAASCIGHATWAPLDATVTEMFSRCHQQGSTSNRRSKLKLRGTLCSFGISHVPTDLLPAGGCGAILGGALQSFPLVSGRSIHVQHRIHHLQLSSSEKVQLQYAGQSGFQPLSDTNPIAPWP